MSDAATHSAVKKSESQKTRECILIGSNQKLTLADSYAIGMHPIPVKLSKDALPVIKESYEFLETCVNNRMPIYGVNTNFGDQVGFVDVTPSYESISARQENLIKSLDCSIGNIIPEEIVRTTMMLRAHCLSQGYSGVHTEAIEAIIAYVNAGITPIVRQYGSIGASGDLIPLSTIAAAIIGENVDVLYQGQIMKAPVAMELAGLTRLKPQLRDGLAMINGTSFMTATASLALYQLKRLFKQMLSAVAMSLESMMVISSSYNPLVHQLKRQSGEMAVNDFMNTFWKGSKLLSDLDELRNAQGGETAANKSVKPVQDYYSLRSVPQGFGPFYENLERATQWIENEMNSVNDNPIIDAKKREIHHGANFMGYYVTNACDILKMDISTSSTWIHALLSNMVHPRKSHHLPANLVENPGKNNGFRSMQLLAAALAVQNRKFAQSHQAYTLPTEGDNQDVNSLGTHAAIDLRESVANLERLTAVMLLASTQALELRGVELASKNAQHIYHLIREHSATVLECRPMTDELNTVIRLLQEEKI